MSERAPRIVFMGSPEIAVPTLRGLAQFYPVVGVVTQPDRPAGRGRLPKPPAVKLAAAAEGIPVIQPEKMKDPGVFETLQEWNPDLIVVMAFGKILRKKVLDLPRYGCINIHASVLPRWRGASPIQAAILAGDSETGISIMQMDSGMDTGAVYAIERCPIDPQDTAATLSEKLANLGADLFLRSLPLILDGTLSAKPQSDEGVTYAPLISKEDGKLDFRLPAFQSERKIRAYNPWPTAYFFHKGSNIKVYKAHIVETSTMDRVPGKTFVYRGLPAVMTGEDALVFDEIQSAGRKVLSGKDFLSGYRNWEEGLAE